MSSPTEATYDELQIAFDFFNTHLFDSQLPQCLITLQREKRTYGYFSPERFINSDGEKTDEIAMNPAYFAICPPEEVLQTLVHEMTHLWQYHFGKAGRAGYHNKEWAFKMESIGLMPSATGKEGGAKTGDKMSDYIIKGGRFEKWLLAYLPEVLGSHGLIDSLLERKQSRPIAENSIDDIKPELEQWGVEIGEDGEVMIGSDSKPTRAKFTCPECSTNVWGKPSLNIVCGDCNTLYLKWLKNFIYAI